MFRRGSRGYWLKNIGQYEEIEGRERGDMDWVGDVKKKHIFGQKTCQAFCAKKCKFFSHVTWR